MEIRNPAYNVVGTFDCEINHPKFGWIPFTASPDDSDEIGREVHAQIIAGAAVAVAPYVAPSTSSEQKASESRSYLASTDWYVVRRSETDEPIPQDVMDKRAAARAAANV